MATYELISRQPIRGTLDELIRIKETPHWLARVFQQPTVVRDYRGYATIWTNLETGQLVGRGQVGVILDLLDADDAL